jgi:hypothetical protein
VSGRLLGVVAVAAAEVVFFAVAGAVLATIALVVNVVPVFDEAGEQLAPTLTVSVLLLFELPLVELPLVVLLDDEAVPEVELWPLASTMVSLLLHVTDVSLLSTQLTVLVELAPVFETPQVAVEALATPAIKDAPKIAVDKI